MDSNSRMRTRMRVRITLLCLWLALEAPSETAAKATVTSPKTLVGLHSDELVAGEGQLVVPRRVHADGKFMTHSLAYAHDRDHRRHRQRRDASLLDQQEQEEQPAAELHLQLPLANETLHLELMAHSYFLAPHLVVERHRRDLRTRSTLTARHLNCHFHGKVRGQPDTNVAISTCSGLVGHIRTASNEYFIEPSKQHEAHPVTGHPHIVFQRSSVRPRQSRMRNKRKRGEGSSGATSTSTSSPGSEVSNCGTREPRRRMETRLEWQARGKVKIQGGRQIRRRHHHKHHHNHRRLQQRKSQPRKLQLHQTKFKYETQDMPRRRRSISSPRHVETLIVADATMSAFHKDLNGYLLTIMNMVSALYKDPSIGNSIEIVVVRIIQLDEEESQQQLNLTQNAQKNLDRFCSWQHKLNKGSEKDPHHHDVAILITRKNICANNCMTLGLANVGGMCKPKQSCSVNEDNGIMLSHTITHELGHNFGMFHDTAKIGCHPRVGPIVHIMTPTFGADTLQVCWSNCSRKYITHFLDQGLGECLDDPPTPLNEYNYTGELPGMRYNARGQCRLQFNLTNDSEVGACSAPHEFCSTLWCKVNGECVTHMRPTAPGTLCGRNKWCQNGKCVRREELTAINGGWGDWSEWSECSRSCGGGVSTQQRECDSPVPANGGVFCIGERKRYKICRKRPCPEQEPSFRAQQCARFDNVSYQGATYKWLPFFDKDNPCRLFCSDVDDTIIANWGSTVLDGTPCTLGTNNMCIDGICKKVGCDWIVDSEMQDDRCGICGGSGDQCQPVRDVFTDPFAAAKDGAYVEIVTIPARARHILIREQANSPHFLAVGRAHSDRFYLNGDSLISMPGEFEIAGAESLYDRVDEQETITIPQPIQHSISLYAIVRGNESNSGIFYEFTLPALNISAGRQLLWRLSNWTACSASCGGGVQHREPVCQDNGKTLSDTLPCWTHAKNRRPQRQARTCAEQPCPAHWWPGPWQFCPLTCRPQGSTAPPLRRRSVVCLDQHDVVVADAECAPLAKPPETEPCEGTLPYCRAKESRRRREGQRMNKVGKHIQSGVSSLSNGSNGGVLSAASLLGSPLEGANGAGTATNVFNSIIGILPDNRPITSLHIVEDFERCPKNFNAIHRTYDQDSDADLWRDYSIFGRQNTRYLCLSKSEGLPEYVVETLQVIAEKTAPPKEFSLLSRTADSDQKAWRKRQIAYKLSKRGTVTQAVTDIILCSKLKVAPDGFKLAGDINGVLICYKTGAIPVRLPPPVPGGITNGTEVEQALNRLNLQGQRNSRGPLPQPPTEHHDYEEIQANYQINSPQRPAPPRPAGGGGSGTGGGGGGRGTYGGTGTLGTYTELEGVPFVMDARLQRHQAGTDIPALPEISTLLKSLDYDFQLERQILCTMKSSASKNPFFK